MSYATNLWIFFALLVGIIVVPGMDMLFVLGNALSGGRRIGLAATAGIMLGGAFHAAFGALGIGLIIEFAPRLFKILLLTSATYMAWIGLTLVRSSITVSLADPAPKHSAWVALRQGAVTAILNPKAYLFVLSVFPQFITPRYGALWWQDVMLGLMIVTAQFGVYGGLAIMASRSRDALVSYPRTTMFLGRFVGLLLIAVAALTVWKGWV